jgi:hypothetical protein
VIFRAELYADFEESGPPHFYRWKASDIEKSSQGSSNRPNSKTFFSPTHSKNINETSVGRNKAVPDFLNPDCSIKHYLKECSLTFPSRKDELFAELAARRKKNGEQRMTRRDVNTSMTPTPRATAKFGSPTEGNGAKALRSLKPSPACRLKACFQSQVDCIALPDSGADDNVIPRSLVRSLEEQGVFVPIRNLQTPLHIEVAFQGPGLSAEVRQQAQLNVELSLPAGPLCLRNCKWLIVEQEMDEVLLGRQLLEALVSTPRYIFHLRELVSTTWIVPVSPLRRQEESSRACCSAKRSRRQNSALFQISLSSECVLWRHHRCQRPPGQRACLQTRPQIALLQSGWTKPKIPSHMVSKMSTRSTFLKLLDMPKPSDGEDVSIMLEGMISQAKINGLPSELMPAMRELLKDFSDIWSISLTAGPPAKLPPLVINLKTDAIPVRVRLRRYSQEQREFLSRFVAQLEASSMVYRNPRAAWCAAPLLVPKKGTAQFLFTVDLRPVNKQTVPISWPMPHVESELSRLHGSNYFIH